MPSLERRARAFRVGSETNHPGELDHAFQQRPPGREIKKSGKFSNFKKKIKFAGRAPAVMDFEIGMSNAGPGRPSLWGREVEFQTPHTIILLVHCEAFF